MPLKRPQAVPASTKVQLRGKHVSQLPSNSSASPAKSAVLSLTQWFSASARQLPWRKPWKETSEQGKSASKIKTKAGHPFLLRDPYATWISEVMLQQTQVETVKEYWRRWMERFPTVEALAKAKIDTVLQQWAGLGYYSRARNIHATAQKILTDFGGVFPTDRKHLLSLPGVGEYTAGAILSLAFGLPEPLLDGNVIRVLSRYHGFHFGPFDRKSQLRYWEASTLWVRSGPPPEKINEGLMELGALVCVVKLPHCKECPLRASCWAYKHGETQVLPIPKTRPTLKEMTGFAFIIRASDQVLICTSAKGEFLAGQENFPILWAKPSAQSIPDFWNNHFPGIPVKGWTRHPQPIKHTITHHRLTINVWIGDTTSSPSKTGVMRWLSEERVESALISSLGKKIWKSAKDYSVR